MSLSFRLLGNQMENDGLSTSRRLYSIALNAMTSWALGRLLGKHLSVSVWLSVCLADHIALMHSLST